MNTSGYQTNKLLHHPDLLADLRVGRVPAAPRVVHLMPELRCRHRCSFCAYQARPEGEDGPEQAGWKNMELHSGRESLLRDAAERLVADLEAMGSRAVELTGGGEPLLWPHVDWLFERLAADRSPLELALVTSGTLLTPERAELFGRTRWKWARVSVDAGSSGTYARVRRVPQTEWSLAWHAIELLARERDRGGDPERRVGVGFVVDRSNYAEVYDACRLACAHGADNIRVSVAFTPQHLDRFIPGTLDVAAAEARHAQVDLGSDRFRVVDLVSERAANLASPAQDYPYCAAKDVLCVVGGDANVYTCCSLAFNSRGLVGSIEPNGFRALWERTMPRFSARHDPRRDCPVECLYERRNRDALRMLATGEAELAAERVASPPPIHVNYL